MKKVLGLDLGTNSIGWALVNEAQNQEEQSEIIKLGVRVNPLTIDEKTNFEKGKPLTTNADRTLKRSARRNLQRFKLRRQNLIELLIREEFILKDTPLTETGSNSTHNTLHIRAKSAKEKVELHELALVLLALNKKRGYKSNRKVNNDDEGIAVDGMSIAKYLYENQITPGQYVHEQIEQNNLYIPDFYRSDLRNEFDAIWQYQKQFHPEFLDDELYEKLLNQGKVNSQKRILAIKGIYTAENKGKREIIKRTKYLWRANALKEKLSLEILAYVLVDINNDLNKSSGYLGAISDRSKELYFNQQTVGQNLYAQIKNNPHTSLKNQVFYRQDYLDEFEKIWDTQSKFHSELTLKLKEEIRDIVIFYQRKLKSQKGQISYCQLESWEQTFTDTTTGKTKKRTIGRKVVPKSSPIFQEFKIWQTLNNLEFENRERKELIEVRNLDQEIREDLFLELNIRGKQSSKSILGILKKQLPLGKLSEWTANYEEVEGNNTNARLFSCYEKIAQAEGYGHDWTKKSVTEIIEELETVFQQIAINPEILHFNSKEQNLENQKSFQLWHLLYATEEEDKVSDEDRLVYGAASVALKKQLHQKFGFPIEHAKLLASVTFENDYGNLSAKAIRNIIPYLEEGNKYSEACENAGYNHSNSITKEENLKRELLPKLELLQKNSLRNPVVEKILNQMVNVVNQIIETYGKPDEIRIELARELKKSAKERENMSRDIANNTRLNDDIRKLLTKEFKIPNPTKTDVVRYKLWKELESRGYKDIFTGVQIKKQDLFSSKIDIEHIIPKALRFDDSFSNKTLAFRKDNLKKGKRTAYDFINEDYHQKLEAYTEEVENWYKSDKIKKTKRDKLLITQSSLGDGFIERDLRNSQYIAKKAKDMLLEIARDVTSTTGSITDKLRSDWDLINMMKELNLPKYRALGLTETIKRWDSGQEKETETEVISGDWSKRNDHRHHAMDALTVAFTSHNHIQYINNLSARRDVNHEMHPRLKNIEAKIIEKNKKGKNVYKTPFANFRNEAKKHVESILISFKNKNKVVTKNINVSKGKNAVNKKEQLTPRGQLHKETVYGRIKLQKEKPTKLNKKFTLEDAKMIVNKDHKKIVINHLALYNNNSESAFNTKTLKQTPLLFKDEVLKEVFCFEYQYTIRKELNPENFKTPKLIDKVIDEGTKQKLLERLKLASNDPKKAFGDVENNPIWLNEKARIPIKRVTIKGVNNAESLHIAKNHFGEEILDENGEQIPVDFVSTGNNHHVAIYEDQEGNLHEKVVSLFEAVQRKNLKLPVIDKDFNKHLGWTFKFTMKQNEMFVFPTEDFDPATIDLLDEKNFKKISPHLFRVQKLSNKDYMFRHHLETTVTNNLEFTHKPIWSENKLKGIVKVRINHIGQIVQIGEY